MVYIEKVYIERMCIVSMSYLAHLPPPPDLLHGRREPGRAAVGGLS